MPKMKLFKLSMNKISILLFLLVSFPVLATPITLPDFYEIVIPEGGVSQGAAPGGSGAVVSYEYKLDAKTVSTTLHELLKSSGWTIANQSLSPRGTERFDATKNNKIVKISIVGVGNQTAIILTRQ